MKQADKNWVSKVRNLSFTYGYIWIAQDVGDIGMFISQFKQRLTDCPSLLGVINKKNSSHC